MGAITRIAWCNATFNPWIGCLRVSTACDRCYAAALSWRYGWRDSKRRDLWDTGADRKRTSAVYWRGPLRWNERAQAEGTQSRVSCASMADVFDNKVPAPWRARFVVTDPLDTCARLVPAHEETAKHPRHATGGLGRWLAPCLAWHHDREPRGSQSPHPAPCHNPGCGQVPQRGAHDRASRYCAVAGPASSRHEGTNFLDHRWGRIRRRRPPDASGLARGLRDQVHAGGAKLFVKQIGSNHVLW